MKCLRVYFFALFMIANLCPVVAMEQILNTEPVTLRLDLLSLEETARETAQTNPATPAAPAAPRTDAEQKKRDNDLYAACKGADPVEEGQPRVVDIARVRELLVDGANINMKGSLDNSPLHVACRFGLTDLVAELLALAWNPNIDAVNAFNMTALYFAAGQGFDEIVALLCAKDAHKELADVNGMTPLHAAVLGNRLSTAGLLIDSGAIVNAPNTTGALPIHTALLSTPINLDMLTLLLRNGANLGAADAIGLTPLKIVFNSKDINLSLFIVNSDVNEDVRRAFEPFFLNAMFCVNKDIRILQALLAKGMDKNIKLQNGWTPLHFACGLGCMDIAEFLIRGGADLEVEARDGRTPLECCTKAQDTSRLLEVVTQLMLA